LEADNSITYSDRIVLNCKSCGDNLIPLGLEEDWHSESTNFECECGTMLAFLSRSNAEARAIKRLLRENVGSQAATRSRSKSLSHRR
jgi:hypothetical protein